MALLWLHIMGFADGKYFESNAYILLYLSAINQMVNTLLEADNAIFVLSFRVLEMNIFVDWPFSSVALYEEYSLLNYVQLDRLHDLNKRLFRYF